MFKGHAGITNGLIPLPSSSLYLLGKGESGKRIFWENRNRVMFLMYQYDAASLLTPRIHGEGKRRGFPLCAGGSDWNRFARSSCEFGGCWLLSNDILECFITPVAAFSDQEHLDEEINTLRKELRVKVNHLFEAQGICDRV